MGCRALLFFGHCLTTTKITTLQNQQHIASTMAVAIVSYDHPFYSNFEYFDQEEQSPKNPGTCTQ
jgi:hypothetical protein